MDLFHDLFTHLRFFNGYLALLVCLFCLLRIALVIRFWRKSFKEGTLYEELNLEKLTAWIALFIFNLTTGISSLQHAFSHSITGIWIPLVTLGIIITIGALLVSKRTLGERMLFERVLKRKK